MSFNAILSLILTWYAFFLLGILERTSFSLMLFEASIWFGGTPPAHPAGVIHCHLSPAISYKVLTVFQLRVVANIPSFFSKKVFDNFVLP